MPKTREMRPTANIFIISFLLFIFFSNALESLSNCIDSSAIIYDFLSAESSSDILVVRRPMFPFIIPYSSITLVFSLSIFSLALNSLIRSAIFMRSFSLSLPISHDLYSLVASLKKLEATDIDEAYFDNNISCVNVFDSAKLWEMYDAVGNTILHWAHSQTQSFGSSSVS